MRSEKSVKLQLEFKKETYRRIKGTAKISEFRLKGWIDALEYVLEIT